MCEYCGDTGEIQVYNSNQMAECPMCESSQSGGLLVCDHDWKWVDESFDHEYGVDRGGYYECEHCGEIDPDRDYEYEPLPDDVM